MKYLKFALLITALNIFSFSSAFAWTAVAYSIDSGYTFIQYQASDAAEAKKLALEGCSKKALQCELVGNAIDGPTTTVVVKGDGGMAKSSNTEPNVAARNALELCQKSYKNCRITNAVWDGGTHWVAIAKGPGVFRVIYNNDSKDIAEQAALRNCNSDIEQNERCEIWKSLDVQIWVAIVESALHIGLGTSATKQDAIIMAKNSCELNAKKTEACDKVEVIENKGPTPEPASLKKLLAKIEAKNTSAPTRTPVSKAPVPTIKSERYSQSCQNASCIRKYDDGRVQRFTACLNPATMLPMNGLIKLGGCGGFDSQGHPFGMQ